MPTTRHRRARPVPLLALAALAGAATHEVDSVAALQAALAAAQPRDEVVLKRGTYRIEHPLQIRVDGLILRGATGEAKDVEIVGGGMDPRDTHLQDAIDVATDDVLIADLTVRDFSFNGIHLRGENDVDRLTIRNVTTRNIGEVHIKGSRATAPDTVDNVLIDHCRLIQDQPRLMRPETDTGSDYIGGIDIMCAKDIVIRDSVFTGIHGSKDEGKPAIFLWQGAINPTIERNRISGCARGIGIGNPGGLGAGAYHAIGGVVRDNVIERGPWGGGNTIAIELCSVKDLQVLHNTVYSADAGYFRTVSIYDVEGAGAVEGLLLANNLIRGQIKDFTAGTGWKQRGDLVDGIGSTITAAWFVDAEHGDFHLTEAAGAAFGAGEKLNDAPTDLDGDPRPANPDLGADQRVAAAQRDGAASPVVAAAPPPPPAESQEPAMIPTLRAFLLIAAAGFAAAPAGEDMAQANGYDDAWQPGWIGHCREVFTSEGKTTGLVLQVGDSITHANPYSGWPRRGAGKTADDAAIIAWCHAEAPFSGSQNDPANPNGFYLAAADTTGARGMTCASGIDTAEFLAGANNGGTAMPDEGDKAKARAIIADGQYSHDLRASTMAAAFSDAQIAVIMLGTNDVKSGRPVGEIAANLGRIVDVFEARRIVVVLSTIPPWPDAAGDQVAAQICEAIAKLARERGLPLIDYRAEILARRPGGSANGTLMGAGDVHPSAGDSGGDPYANGGDPATHRTGAACRDSGYLLRSWLTIQKLKEVKAALVDGVGAGTAAKTAAPAAEPAKPAKPGAKPAKPAKR